MLHGVIYKITNNQNDKVYIGKTTRNENEYWKWHKAQANNGVRKVLYHAMRKHGLDNFKFEVVHDVLSPTFYQLNKVLSALEIRYIKFYNAKIPSGYNLTIGGEGVSGLKRSDEFKEKLRIAKTGKKRPEWVIVKLRKPKSELHKAKMRKPKSELHKAKLREAWLNKSEEEKRAIFKICVDNRRDYYGEDNPFYGRKHRKETVELIRAKNSEFQNRADVKIINKLKQPTRIGVDMIDPKNGNVLNHFITLTDAKRWIAKNTKYKGDVATISKAVKSGRLSYGYYWYENTNESVETIEMIN